MESSAWTNERLDDLSRRVDHGFARVDQDIRELRRELHEGFQGINGLLLRIGGGIIVALIGVIAAILARGV